MKNINKILAGIFSILLIVIVGEVIYFYFTKNTPTITNVYRSSQASPTPSNPQKRFQSYTDWLNKLRSILESSIMIDESKGTIADIERGTNTKGEFTKILVTGKKGSHSFYFYQNDLNITTVMQTTQTSSEETNASFADLQKGRNITIRETYNLLPIEPKRVDIKIIITE